MADIHTRVLSTKQTLSDMLNRTKQALRNINSGKYGKCEKCGKPIEEKRLEAMPTATKCISCSKKASK
jgi:DnaK suppressor protein